MTSQITNKSLHLNCADTSDIIFGMSSVLKASKQLTPKVTHTKINITKSTPFLISRHHLDDSQMKKVLHYETGRATPNRTYSYQGEVITCQSSRPVSKIQEPLQNTMPTYPIEPVHHDYYNSSNQKQLNSTHHNNQAPYFKQRPRQYSSGGQRQVQLYKKQVIKSNREVDRLRRELAQKEDYGLKEMKTAREKMEKQAKRLRKLYKKKVQKDIHQLENDQVGLLQQQIRRLKIQTYEMEKQKLMQQLGQNMAETKKPRERSQSHTKGILTKAQIILNKPRYQPVNRGGQDTDSSFSSFQFN